MKTALWLALALVVGSSLGLSLLPGCAGEECLAYNENCSRDYKLAEYGTEDIDCCEGVCQEGTISGALICRN